MRAARYVLVMGLILGAGLAWGWSAWGSQAALPGAASQAPAEPGSAPVASGLATLVASRCTAGGSPAASGVTEEWCRMGQASLRLLSLDAGDAGATGGGEISVEVLVAADDRTRQAGYQWIDPALVQATATLFVFPRPISGAFHMCNVDAPLWIVWYQEDGTPLDAALMLPGADVPVALCRDVYAPRRAGLYRFALEIGVGLARELGLEGRQLAAYRLDVEPWVDTWR